jgi:fumarate hydratase class II
MVMVCLQVIGEDSIVIAAGAQGNFELNAMRPIIINNVLHSAPRPGRRVRESCERSALRAPTSTPRGSLTTLGDR